MNEEPETEDSTNNCFQTKPLSREHQINGHKITENTSEERVEQRKRRHELTNEERVKTKKLKKPVAAAGLPPESPQPLPNRQRLPDLVCPHCGAVFAGPGRSDRKNGHIRARNLLDRCPHTLKDKFKCHWMGCNSVFNSQQGLDCHLLTHPVTYRCDWKSCKFSTTSFLSLRKHSSGHYEKLYVCPVCDKRFLNKEFLREHRMAVHQMFIKISDN